MSERTFDPTVWFDSFRDTFASVNKAQQESFKPPPPLARFQYAVAGDYLEAGIAQTQVALSAKTPVELLSKQADLGKQLGEKIRVRAEEFSTLASEAQGSVSSFVNETAARASASAKKAA
jgi:hypothetical protein